MESAGEKYGPPSPCCPRGGLPILANTGYKERGTRIKIGRWDAYQVSKEDVAITSGLCDP